jgi:hypothetical protein
MSKNTRTLAIALTVALAAALSPAAIWGQEVCPGPANAKSCYIDNFNSAFGKVGPVTSSTVTVNQPLKGTSPGIVGGTRTIQLGTTSAANQFLQPTQVQVVPKSSTNPTPALVWSSGFMTFGAFSVIYGDTQEGVPALNLNLSQYNPESNGRFRLAFAGVQEPLTLNFLVYSSGQYFDCGIGLGPVTTNFTLDFPFDQLSPQSGSGTIDWTDIDIILFEAEGGSVGAPQLAVTSIAAIQYTASTTPPDYTCQQPTQ